MHDRTHRREAILTQNYNEERVNFTQKTIETVKNIILVILLLFLCCKKTSNPNNNKIIYTLNKELTEKILDKYSNVDKTKNYYVQFFVNYRCTYSERMIVLEYCDDCNGKCFIEKSIKNTNRFLKLSDNILLPVIFEPDYLFEKDKTNKLRCRTGKQSNCYYFIIDGRNKLVGIE